jgi:hypothetical protein
MTAIKLKLVTATIIFCLIGASAMAFEQIGEPYRLPDGKFADLQYAEFRRAGSGVYGNYANDFLERYPRLAGEFSTVEFVEGFICSEINPCTVVDDGSRTGVDAARDVHILPVAYDQVGDRLINDVRDNTAKIANLTEETTRIAQSGVVVAEELSELASRTTNGFAAVEDSLRELRAGTVTMQHAAIMTVLIAVLAAMLVGYMVWDTVMIRRWAKITHRNDKRINNLQQGQKAQAAETTGLTDRMEDLHQVDADLANAVHALEEEVEIVAQEAVDLQTKEQVISFDESLVSPESLQALLPDTAPIKVPVTIDQDEFEVEVEVCMTTFPGKSEKQRGYQLLHVTRGKENPTPLPPIKKAEHVPGKIRRAAAKNCLTKRLVSGVVLEFKRHQAHGQDEILSETA